MLTFMRPSTATEFPFQALCIQRPAGIAQSCFRVAPTFQPSERGTFPFQDREKNEVLWHTRYDWSYMFTKLLTNPPNSCRIESSSRSSRFYPHPQPTICSISKLYPIYKLNMLTTTYIVGSDLGRIHLIDCLPIPLAQAAGGNDSGGCAWLGSSIWSNICKRRMMRKAISWYAN
jgi:hypothetical protein